MECIIPMQTIVGAVPLWLKPSRGRLSRLEPAVSSKLIRERRTRHEGWSVSGYLEVVAVNDLANLRIGFEDKKWWAHLFVKQCAEPVNPRTRI
jgi:hypothetical protein